MRRLAAWTERRSVLGLAVLLALLATAPSLRIGLVLDDYAHREFVQARLRPGAAAGPSIAMFGEPLVDPRAVSHQIGVGLLPWWSSPHFSQAFFRPLSVATHYIDYGLFPDTPVLMHLHNMLWYAALVLLVGVLYRRLLVPGPLAALALLMYALDEAHSDGMTWIASRNTLLTACFAVGCLLLFDRARRSGSRRLHLLSALTFALALGCSEGAIAVLGYVFAYALFLDRAPLRARALACLPFGVVLAGYAWVYRALHYGARSNGLYLDPLHAPLAYLAALGTRLPVVLREQFGVPAFLELLLPGAFAVEAWIGPALLLASIPVALSLLRRSPTSRFFLAGLLLSALPICAVWFTPRLLFLVGLGGAAFTAELMAEAIRLARMAGPRALRVASVLVAGTGLLLHALLPLVLAPLAPGVYDRYDRDARAAEAALPAEALLRDRSLLLLNVPSYALPVVGFLYRGAVRRAPLHRAHILGASMLQVQLSRPARNTLLLVPEGGYLIEPWSRMVRGPEERFSVGHTVLLPDLAVTVATLTPDGRPASILLTVPDPESPKLLWAAWNAKRRRFAPLELPAVGGSVTLDGAWR